jgi:hypothetical protein
MKFLIWLLIGRFTLEAWLSFNPIDQTELLRTVIERYCDHFSCHKAEIMIKQSDNYLEIYATCKEVMI